MSLSAPRAFYGVHSFTPYSRADSTFYGTIKVLKSSSLSLSASLVNLMGGSSKYPWETEEGEIKAEMSLKFSEYPDWIFQLFLGKAPTDTNTSATGTIDNALTNSKGTSLVNATTGVASVAVKSGSDTDLKFGKYVVVAVSATTVDVYLSSDVDIGRGTKGSYVNDLLKITATPLTITTGGALTTITNFGLTLVGGSGTIGMTTGDTATFSVFPDHTGAMAVTIGGISQQIFPEFGALVVAQKRGNSELVEVDALRCKAAGFPINFNQNAWSEADIKVQLMYDAVKDGVFSLRHVKPSGT